MALLTYPGIYVEEVPSGVRPIAAASTSTPAFVGLTERGSINEAKRITNWTEFQKFYGSFIADSKVAETVFQFFNNGGQQCYIVRVVRENAEVADVTVQNRAQTSQPADTFKFLAKNPGAWGNYLYLQIEDGSVDPGNEFKVSVRMQKKVDVVPEDFLNLPTLEVHDNLSMDPNAGNYAVDVLKRNSYFIDATVPEADNNKSLQQGVHRGGLDPLLDNDKLTGLGDNRRFLINVDYDGWHLVELSDAVADPGDGTMAEYLAAVATEIKNAVQGLKAHKKKKSTDDEAFQEFVCRPETITIEGVERNRLVLESGTNKPQGKSSKKSSVRIQNASEHNAAALLKLGEAYGGLSEDALAIQRPAKIDIVQIGDNAIEGPVIDVTEGTDGDQELTESDYSKQFAVLDNKMDFSLLAVPGIGTTTMMDFGVAYCENRPLRDVFYIGEMGFDVITPDAAESFRKALTKPNSYGAVYFPWIKTLDPSGKSMEPILLPPSGYVAGLYARIDASRGVWKAPAGTEATLSGTVGLAMDLTDVEQGNLNRINVNCIRRFPAAGIVGWGARTVTSDPEYQYIPVRRMAIMLRVSIYNGIQWAVFEPNDEELWSQLRLNIRSFMMTLFRQGAFQGSTPSQAFFVKCDSETTTQDDINLGIVNVLVGFAPLKPAEFVVVKISQKAGQSS